MIGDATQRIGTVAAVESERVTIEVDPKATGLVKAGTAGVLPIGAINSYLTISAGSTRVVAVVTAMRMAQERSQPRDSSTLVDPALAVSRTLEATMVGRLEGDTYHPGLTSYPSIFAPVAVATRADLQAIFRAKRESFRIGEAVVAPDQDVSLDADALLGHHFAILGTTGSGKSCSVVGLLDGLFELDLPTANVVIFDTNGEYAAAFAPTTARAQKIRTVTIGPEPGQGGGLFVPQWFMNSDEHLELLRAAEGVQAPLLQRAIADARVASQRVGAALHRVRVISTTLANIEHIARNEKKVQEKLQNQLRALWTHLSSYISTPDELVDVWSALRTSVDATPSLELNAESWDLLTAPQIDTLNTMMEDMRSQLRDAINRLGLGSAAAAQDFDAPSYFSLEDLAEIFLPQRIELEQGTDPRIAAFAVSMQLRLGRLLADERYSFMTRVSPFDRSLAFFLRLIFGAAPLGFGDEKADVPWREAVNATATSASHDITIVDLSLVSQDVLSVVTALIARLILDLAQRLEPRAALPVLIVLEEAHRYVRRGPQGQRDQASVVFERIAKEGRKFGVSLGLATQRPSELDPTVLSQCGTLIAHRIVSESDQELIRAATPLASREVIRQLPGLAKQHAVVLGVAVPAPVAVRVRQVDDPPDSGDPAFLKAWRSQDVESAVAFLDAAADEWERGLRRRVSEPARRDEGIAGAVEEREPVSTLESQDSTGAVESHDPSETAVEEDAEEFPF